MADYPINLRIAGKKCIVVGGGAVACRKVKSLLAAGAEVTVFSPALTLELAEMVKKKQFNYVARPYHKGDLSGFFLAICAFAVSNLYAQKKFTYADIWGSSQFSAKSVSSLKSMKSGDTF